MSEKIEDRLKRSETVRAQQQRALSSLLQQVQRQSLQTAEAMDQLAAAIAALKESQQRYFTAVQDAKMLLDRARRAESQLAAIRESDARTRRIQFLDVLRSHVRKTDVEWTVGRLKPFYRKRIGPTYRATIRRDLERLTQLGVLRRVDTPNRRYYLWTEWL